MASPKFGNEKYRKVFEEVTRNVIKPSVATTKDMPKSMIK